jgi:GNAT superfamily N-acetyltransferase
MLIHQRFWRAVAEASAAVAVAMAAAGHESAAVEELGDGVLVALGPGRYVNRSIGVGPDLDDHDLTVIERFFTDRGLAPSVQLTSWAGEETLERLTARGYRPQWFRSVFATALPLPDLAARDHLEIVEVDERSLQPWLETLVEGNEIAGEGPRAISDEYGLAAHLAVGSTDLLAFANGHPAGCGSLQITSGVGLLGGAATRPPHRGRGIQGALLRHRIRLAAEAGCDLVASTALPAGPSARNLQRHGLRLIDTQLVLTAY